MIAITHYKQEQSKDMKSLDNPEKLQQLERGYANYSQKIFRFDKNCIMPDLIMTVINLPQMCTFTSR